MLRAARRGLALVAIGTVAGMLAPALATASGFSERAAGSYSISADGIVDGTATLSGTLIKAGSVTFSLNCGSMIGSATLTAASGGTITESFVGVSCVKASSSAPFALTGGTGAFSGASGSGTLIATNDFAGGFTLTARGTFSRSSFARELSAQTSGSYSISSAGKVAGRGRGSGTPIGPASVTFGLNCASKTGHATVTADAGGSLDETIRGVSCLTTFSAGTFTITGGTGRFSGAQGSGVLAASNDLAGSFSITERGTLVSGAPAVSRVVTRRDGSISLSVAVPGPGTVDVLETAWNDNLASIAVLEPAAHRFVFSRQRLTVGAAGVYRIRTRPNARGGLLVRQHRYPVTLRLWVTFHAPEGRPQSRGIYGLHLASRR